MDKLIEEMNNAIDFASSDDVSKGYIILAKDKSQTKENLFKKDDEKTDLEFYDRFIPYLFTQFESSDYREYENFNDAVDQYYSKLELQRIEKQRLEREVNATKKLENVKRDQEKRIKDLEEQEQEYELKAQLIEQNVKLVDSIITTINGYLATQMSWQVLDDLVKQEKKKGNPMASMIHRLSLDKNIVSILLYDTDWEMYATDEQNESTVKLVDIDLAHTAHTNVAMYFQKKKNASIKRAKTIEAAQQAYKSAEKKAYTELKEVGSKSTIQQIRKPYWFEKFNWFFTSDGYIVVSGRDVQQNELLYKKYLNKGDKYVHADIHGASTCIIKNPNNDELPYKTLKEAGTLSICHSKGWKNKIVSSAWWVDDSQVSKTAPSGEYLSTGSFMIRGKKNFLPPTSLVMGIGILFKLADESIPSHVTEITEDEIRKEKEKKFLEKDRHREMLIEEEGENYDNEEQDASSHDNNVDYPHDIVNAIEELDIEEQDIDVDDGSVDKLSSNEDEANEDEKEESSQKEDIQEDNEDAHDKDGDSKYALNIIRDESDDEENLLLDSENQSQQSAQQQNPSRKRKMTKQERKRLKRIEQGKPPAPQQNNKNTQSKANKPVNKEVPQQLPRGKKGKLKKMKQKYKYQDEEERKIAMDILASSGASKKAGKKKEKEEDEQKRLSELQKKREFQQQQRERQLKKEKEEEEIRQLLREENLEMLSDEALQKMKEESSKTLGINIRSFTSSPKEGDVLLYAMAVCAPYDALSDYKYKVKVTPGNLKKGKAVKLAMELISNQRNITDVEKDLIKSIPETELTRVMISNAHVQGAGLLAIIKKKKKQKKKQI